MYSKLKKDGNYMRSSSKYLVKQRKYQDLFEETQQHMCHSYWSYIEEVIAPTEECCQFS